MCSGFELPAEGYLKEYKTETNKTAGIAVWCYKPPDPQKKKKNVLLTVKPDIFFYCNAFIDSSCCASSLHTGTVLCNIAFAMK